MDTSKLNHEQTLEQVKSKDSFSAFTKDPF